MVQLLSESISTWFTIVQHSTLQNLRVCMYQTDSNHSFRFEEDVANIHDPVSTLKKWMSTEIFSKRNSNLKTSLYTSQQGTLKVLRKIHLRDLQEFRTLHGQYGCCFYTLRVLFGLMSLAYVNRILSPIWMIIYLRCFDPDLYTVEPLHKIYWFFYRIKKERWEAHLAKSDPRNTRD